MFLMKLLIVNPDGSSCDPAAVLGEITCGRLLLSPGRLISCVSFSIAAGNRCRQTRAVFSQIGRAFLTTTFLATELAARSAANLHYVKLVTVLIQNHETGYEPGSS
jgi:hypothetical protein